MIIDAYDVLGVGLDADGEEIKKAYKRLSLQHHPDKVQATGNRQDSQDVNDKFNEIKAARDILQDAERRRIYDTFGVDLGEEKPEIEVWTIGLGTLLSPMGTFTLKTFLMRAVLWIVGFRFVGYLLLLLGLVVGVLYAANFKWREYRLRSPEATPMLLNVGLAVGVVVICWLWQLLADAVGVFYLASEVLDVAMLVENWKIGVGAAVASFFAAWLVRGRWLWVIGLEVVVALIVLIALFVASGLMGLWIESVKTQHGDKLREWRLRLRKQRKALQDEVEVLKKKLQEYERGSNGGGAPQAPAESRRHPAR